MPRTCCCRARAAGGATTGPTMRAAWCTAVIDLLVSDDQRGFGLMTALAIEGIPYRRITRAAEFDGRILVVSAEHVDGAAATLARRVPTVVIGERGGTDEGMGKVAEEPLVLSLDDPIWPEQVGRVARQWHGALELPHATLHVAPSDAGGTVLATVQDARGQRWPAVIRRGQQIWCLLD